MEIVSFSETLVSTDGTTWRQNAEQQRHQGDTLCFKLLHVIRVAGTAYLHSNARVRFLKHAASFKGFNHLLLVLFFVPLEDMYV
jgi:hypothetical protein